MIGLTLFFYKKALFETQVLLILGVLSLLVVSPQYGINKINENFKIIDLLTIGSIAMVLGTFLYERHHDEIQYFLGLCVLSAVFLFSAGLIMTLPVIFQSNSTNITLEYIKTFMQTYIKTSFIFVGIVDLLFSAGGLAYLVDKRFRLSKSSISYIG